MTRPDNPWREEEALCRDEPDLFFPPGTSWQHHGDQADAALAVCRLCPLIDACLKWALDMNDRFAIAGGTTPRMRRKLLGLADMDTDACGTFPKGYGRHKRNGEQPCEECRIAANDYQTQRRREKAGVSTKTAAASR